MATCIHQYRSDHICNSEVTFEHALKHAGKQVNELWAIVPCCRSMNNDVTGEYKELNRFVALYRLRFFGFDKVDLKYPRNNFRQDFDYLLHLAKHNLFNKFDLDYDGLIDAIYGERDWLFNNGYLK